MGDMPQSADWNDSARVGHREFDHDREDQCERGHHDHQRDSHARNLHRPGWQCYVFDYSNQSRVSNSVASPDIFTGLMTDHFSNSGSGPAKLNNGFVANVTFGPGEFDFAVDPISSFGDPLNFTDGTAACDPL